MSVNYGSKRTVVGAHYGTRDFLAQRSTAVLMALYTVVLLVRFLTVGGPVGYEQWAGIFAPVDEVSDPGPLRGSGLACLDRRA
jgi:succinate dehydrogenase / fumarate reductase membrane anchor subunit